MKIKHLLVFAVLVLLPLGSAIVLGINSLNGSALEHEARLASQFELRLQDMNRRCQGIEQDWAANLRRFAESLPDDALSLGRASQEAQSIRQVFMVDYQGRLIFPQRSGASQKEQEFLQRSAAWLGQGWLPQRPESGKWPSDGGWYRWYWQDGLQWLYWVPRAKGILGLDLNRAAMLADLAGRLEGPALDSGQNPHNRVRLVDEQGRVFLQWGSYNPGSSHILARVSLGGPLEGWFFSWESDPDNQSDDDAGAATALILSLVALSAAAVFLALFFLQGFRRELREAGQRVSFVNQVSHELKTPLTNIRLYAELLETSLSPQQTTQKEYAAIIEREGRRLGRLIHNVLTFGRKDKVDGIHPQTLVPDQCLADCLSSFAISFAERGLTVESQLACPNPRRFDPDAVDQMLGNLLSNAEKYALSGGRVRLESRETADGFEFSVRDWGEGIPSEGINRLFKPFERFHTELTSAVGGTGLGLYLVRELAQRHGGEVWHENANPGARFVVRISAPKPDGGEDGKSS